MFINQRSITPGRINFSYILSPYKEDEDADVTHFFTPWQYDNHNKADIKLGKNTTGTHFALTLIFVLTHIFNNHTVHIVILKVVDIELHVWTLTTQHVFSALQNNFRRWRTLHRTVYFLLHNFFFFFALKLLFS